MTDNLFGTSKETKNKMLDAIGSFIKKKKKKPKISKNIIEPVINHEIVDLEKSVPKNNVETKEKIEIEDYQIKPILKKINEIISERHISYDKLDDLLLQDSFDDIFALRDKIDSIIIIDKNNIFSNNDELKRELHTIKGVIGNVGGNRAYKLVHGIESAIESNNEKSFDFIKRAWIDVYQLIDSYYKKSPEIKLLDPIPNSQDWLFGDWLPINDELIEPSIILPASEDKIALKDVNITIVKEEPLAPVSDIKKKETDKKKEDVKKNTHEERITLPLFQLDKWNDNVRVAKQSQESTASYISRITEIIDSMDESIRKVGNMARELEFNADAHLQSRTRRKELDVDNFDPLEMDRFTRLQELTRQISESADDLQEIRQEMLRPLSLMAENNAKEHFALFELEQGMVENRLKPMDSIQARLRRTVQLAEEQSFNKKVDFILKGTDIEIDRGLLEKILRPIEHSLRNSIAHGIETVENRLKEGKPSHGTITMECLKNSGYLTWVLTDDGLGINILKVKEKAIEIGLIKKDDVITMKDAVELICQPKFSTSNSVSELSGRGVGMDVVRNDIVSMGGRFQIDSIEGKGTKTTIMVPVSSYTVLSLIVIAGEKEYAIPNELIEDFWIINQDTYESSIKNKKVERNNKKYDIKSFFDIISIDGKLSQKSRNLYAILISDGENKLVVVVDKMLGLFESTMIPLGDIWTTAPWIVGSILLQNGKSTFLINPLGTHGLRVESVKNNNVQTIKNNKKSILVVDDSLTMRKSITRLLKGNGYNIITAKDGKEGFELFSSSEPDLVITDVEMPGMDGFELLKSIKQGIQKPETPVIIITSRTAQKHRQHAESLKANAYLGKPFKNEELLSNLKELLKNE